MLQSAWGQSKVGNGSPAAAEAVARRWLCGVLKAVLSHAVPGAGLRAQYQDEVQKAAARIAGGPNKQPRSQAIVGRATPT